MSVSRRQIANMIMLMRAGGDAGAARARGGVVSDASTLTIYFSQCVSVASITGIQYQINGGGWLAVTLQVKVTDTQWQFTTGTIEAGDEVEWQYLGGTDSIVDCEEAEDIGPQGPIPVQNPLVLAGDFILLETGGSNIILLEDDDGVDPEDGIQLENA